MALKRKLRTVRIYICGVDDPFDAVVRDDFLVKTHLDIDKNIFAIEDATEGTVSAFHWRHVQAVILGEIYEEGS